MTIVVCVDDRCGMLFGGRRQSQDSVLRNRLLERAEGRKLWMNGYSAKQFSQLPQNVTVRENFLQMAGPNDICFVENLDVTDALRQCDRLIMFCWNRHYPADLYFPEPQLVRWTLEGTCDFVGSSHEMITEKIYAKK